MAKVKITPEKATELLKNNDHNRKVTKSRVAEYAKEMLSGMWMYNGESIIISESGRLLDGQHRLMAVIDSDTTIEAELIEGVPDQSGDVDIFLTINTKNRSNVDALTIAGFNDRPHLIQKLLVVRETFNQKKLMINPSGTKVLNHEIVEMARAFGEEEAIRIIDRALNLAYRCDILDKSYWIPAVYIFEKLPKGTEFLETLAECDASVEGSPISALLFRLRGYKTEGGKSGKGGAAVAKEKWFGIFKAYDLFMKKEVVKNLHLNYRTGLHYPMAYPDYEEQSLGPLGPGT